MKLKKIEISNFRSIKEASIEIDNLSVLIGENNSGKSTILKAVELFFEDSVKAVNEEFFHFKNEADPISITATFDRITASESSNKVLRHWIHGNEIKIKKLIEKDQQTGKYSSSFFGWQAAPADVYFDLSRFDEYKENLKKIVEEKTLPEYFKTGKGTVTQSSYKDGVQKHIENGLVAMGQPAWLKNPGGYKEVFASLLPKFYLVPAVKDAQDESKISQQTVLGKLINDLTARIIAKNPKFEEVKGQINSLKRFLNRLEDGSDKERLQEIKDLETNISEILSENMPGSKIEIEIVTPELVDLFKDTKIRLDDSLATSIDSKGHGLQRALIFSYIRAYAKILNTVVDEAQTTTRNFILAIEEPELFLHPNGQRKMMSVLKNMAEYDQVLICTHSSYFVNMFDYSDICIVRRVNNGPTTTIQYKGDIFSTEDEASKKRLKNVFRYLSMFDISRSEMFFSKKVVLVEGDTEKFIIPFWCSKLFQSDRKFDLSANNIAVVECGGKTNLHVFMRVLNGLKIPYCVVHDVDPINFPVEKPEKTDREQQQLRIFKENEFIEKSLDTSIGQVVKINPDIELVVGVSKSQAEKEGKITAAVQKYEDLDSASYPKEVMEILNLICDNANSKGVVEIASPKKK